VFNIKVCISAHSQAHPPLFPACSRLHYSLSVKQTPSNVLRQGTYKFNAWAKIVNTHPVKAQAQYVQVFDRLVNKYGKQ